MFYNVHAGGAFKSSLEKYNLHIFFNFLVER